MNSRRPIVLFRFAWPLGQLFLIFTCLTWMIQTRARADDELVDASITYFSGAKLNEAGVQEIQADVAKMRTALMTHAKLHPSVKVSSTERRDSVGYAYRFKYGNEGDFLLYHPDDYHISLARDIKFRSSETKADIDAALKNATIEWDPFSIAKFANKSKISPKNSSDPRRLIYFTYDFETSPHGTERDQQRQWLKGLADDVTGNLRPVAQQITEATSFHTSFGYASNNLSTASEIRDKVIRALQNYGGYVTLTSTNMEVAAAAILESAHIDDATRYTTYIEEPLGGILTHASALGAGTVYSYPFLVLNGGAMSIAAPDRILIGDAQESDIATYLPWVENDDAVGVVGCDRGTTDQGYLTIENGAHFNIGATAEEDTGHLVVGLKPNDGGVVAVSGAGSTLSVGGDIDVGEYGTGTLFASDGASIFSYGGYLAYRSGSSGSVTLDGCGTVWQALNDFHVGCRGSGILMLSDGAQVAANPLGSSTMYIGTESGAEGQVWMTGADTSINLYEGSLIVGSDGYGAMSVADGATVNCGFGYLGDGSGAYGAVEVIGPESRWDVAYNLWIGVSGHGSTWIGDGGSVACNYLTVAAFDGAAGALAINGSGSSCVVTLDALIGGWMDSDDDVPNRSGWNNGGTATVLVEDGGVFSVGRTVWIGRRGIVGVSGGTLEAENVDVFSGGKLIVSNGGVLDVRSQFSIDGLLQSDVPLSFNSGQSLVGNGTIDATQTRFLAGSLVAPGHSAGTLTFTGGLQLDPGSHTQIELGDGGLCDKLVVAGTFRPGGTLVLRQLSGTSPSWGYTFASTGHTTGAFDTVDASALSTLPKRIISADHWSLIKFKDLREIASTPNAQNMAAVLDPAIDAGQSGWLIDQVVTVGDDSAMNALLAQMSGELYATLSTVGVQNTTNLYRALGDRLRPDMNGLAARGVAYSNVAVSDDPLTGALHWCGGQPSGIASGGGSAWGGWTLGYGLAGQASTDGNAQGVDYSTDGMIVAVERFVDSASRFGVFYSYGGSRVSAQTVAQNAKIDTNQGGVYLCRAVDDDYAMLAGGFGSDSYRTGRSIVLDDTEATALSDHQGWQSAVYVERGHLLRGERWSLQPYGALQYIHIRQEAFAESGALGFNLDVGGSDFDSFRGMLGGRLIGRLRQQGAQTADISFRTIWMHEFLQQTTGLVATTFASGPGSPFVLSGLDLGRDWVVLGPGCSYTINDRVSLFANYDLQFNAQQAIHVGSGGVQFQW